jgi:hypothetical protein
MKRFASALSSFLLAGLLCFAAVKPVSLEDISGDGTRHVIATSGTARWVEVQAFDTNVSPVRLGDNTISTTRGIRLLPGSAMMLPFVPESRDFNPSDRVINLADWNYLVQSGDKITINLGQ